MPHSVAMPKSCHEFFCHCDTTKRTGRAIGVMHQAEIKFRPGSSLRLFEGREVGIVVAITRNRHMDPLKRMLQLGRELICKVNHYLGVCRLQLMLAPRIAVTEMDSQVDILRYMFARANDRGDKFVAGKRF